MNVYINLAVADLAQARTFFGAIGLRVDETFSDDTALAVRIGEGATAMLLTPAKFASFTPRRLANAAETTEVLTALQLESREAVDAMMRRALDAGAVEVRDAEERGFMYGRAFADPDGHIWEPFWMDEKAMQAQR